MALKLRPSALGSEGSRGLRRLLRDPRRSRQSALALVADSQRADDARSDRAATLEQAKAQLRKSWDALEGLGEAGSDRLGCPGADGWMLRTIGDTGAYIALPKKRKRLAHWE
jgi:hypothetical protein